MAVKIGHASIDENGRVCNGNAGDQTGKEVCTRNWYNKPWTSVIRPKDIVIADKIAKAMEQACANNNIGYDQNQRTTLFTQAKANNWNLSKISVKCETDCSALVAVCVNAAGIHISKDIYTGNQLQALKSTGKFNIYTSSDYTSSDTKLRRGDILLSSGHTAIVLSSGSTNIPTRYSLTDFIKDIQSATNAKIDGIAGSETISKTITVSMTINSRHRVVKPIQKRLNALGFNCGLADGVFGGNTASAVKSFQEANGCVADSIITAKNKTWKKLLGMA
jgi:peptidoglycan hydrolase-like protein with peptidoglycan-binding domain